METQGSHVLAHRTAFVPPCCSPFPDPAYIFWVELGSESCAEILKVGSLQVIVEVAAPGRQHPYGNAH
ncbi:hypothetical protein, partial [Blastomonas sp.]|uniref:hypothetical protein n=1 Tax=Blastomonas sp. TaxID=1909299 RepID=UPI003592EA95